MFEHAASDYTAHEMMLAYVAERFESIAEHLVNRGLRRMAVFGGREHSIWLSTHIGAMQTMPIVAYIDRPDRRNERTDIGVPVFQIDDPHLADKVDCVLVSDDRYEDDLVTLARHHLPVGVGVFGLYQRLGIGAEALPGEHVLAVGQAAELERKPVQGVLVPALRDATPALASLTGATLG